MKKFHITYFVDRNEPLLSGSTIEALSIVDAIISFLIIAEGIDVTQIKYVVEL